MHMDETIQRLAARVANTTEGNSTRRARIRYPLVWMAILLTGAPMASMAQTAPTTGKEIYEQMCAGCHGTYGDGGEGHAGGFSPVVPNLSRKDYMALVTDEYLMLVIKKGGEYVGKIATMPAWEKRLSDEQIKSVIAHIRTF
jgi:mono/diheme cytochrome c family protein